MVGLVYKQLPGVGKGAFIHAVLKMWMCGQHLEPRVISVEWCSWQEELPYGVQSRGMLSKWPQGPLPLCMNRLWACPLKRIHTARHGTYSAAEFGFCSSRMPQMHLLSHRSHVRSFSSVSVDRVVDSVCASTTALEGQHWVNY